MMIRAWNEPQIRSLSIFLVVTCLLVFALTAIGRPWWCSCGNYWISSWDVWSQHNSQHFFDPYSFSHFEHGLIFYFLFAWLRKYSGGSLSLSAALFLEALWEFAENSPLIIERYRTATIALGYSGDSIANSISDLLCCYIGYQFSKAFGWRVSLLTILIVEVVMLIVIKDNLILNVLMLVYPIEGIKLWQQP